jgi:DNA-directed RNA polymerase specialized sigma subunit
MSPGRGASFTTFAGHRVRGAMLDELRRLDHLPRRLRNRTDDLVKTRKKLAGDLGREATVKEVANELGVDVEEAKVTWPPCSSRPCHSIPSCPPWPVPRPPTRMCHAPRLCAA